VVTINLMLACSGWREDRGKGCCCRGVGSCALLAQARTSAVSLRVDGEGIDWMQLHLQVDGSRGVRVGKVQEATGHCTLATRPATAFMQHTVRSRCSPQWPSVPQGPRGVAVGCRVCGHQDGGGPHVGSETCRRTAGIVQLVDVNTSRLGIH
jgi:hypothetical protein